MGDWDHGHQQSRQTLGGKEERSMEKSDIRDIFHLLWASVHSYQVPCPLCPHSLAVEGEVLGGAVD